MVFFFFFLKFNLKFWWIYFILFYFFKSCNDFYRSLGVLGLGFELFLCGGEFSELI